MRKLMVLTSIAAESETASEGLLTRAFRRFRLPMREGPNIAQTARLNRAESLFEVNFRTKWTR